MRFKIPFGLEFTTRHLIGIVIGILFLVTDLLYLKGTPFFYPGFVVAFILMTAQFFIDYIMAKQREREIEEKFTEFVRNLVGSVKSGMPFNQAIIHCSHTDYGALSPHVKKLANKVEWAIPMHKALLSFAEEINNKVIKRAIITVLEAEQAGGNIEDVLDSITDSLISIKKMKEKRKASIHSQVIQSYIIFFVFLGIMIIVQNVLIPYLTSVQQSPLAADTANFDQPTFSAIMTPVIFDFSTLQSSVTSILDWFQSFRGIFLMLSLIQGLFAGLVIGKLSEGDIHAGIKHSLILMGIALLVITFAQSL